MATIDTQDLRGMFRRFRVLIIGRANAGKTTILQKVCNTADEPEIYDAKGNKIDAAIVKSSIKRGNHDITNEMVFKSNPVFVFHDSCGFEAGSEEEFEDMKRFVSQRAHATKLENRIHAIWYCIPMDDPSRTFQRSEEKFFLECNTGHVPVVVVFTKFEALRPVAYGEIKKQLKGVSREERSKRIAQCVEELFMNTDVLNKLYKPENCVRPKSHVRLQNMNQLNANCNILLECTTLALDNDELRLCLVLTQQSNMELCIKCAISKIVDPAHQQSASPQIDYEDYQREIAKWFPHLKVRLKLIQSDNSLVMVLMDAGKIVVYEVRTAWTALMGLVAARLLTAVTKRDDIIRVLQPLVAKGSFTAAANRIIQTGIATIIVLEYSAFLDSSRHLERVESAVDYYLNSPTAVAVEKEAGDISRRAYDREELEKKILGFILENRLSKDLTTK
ncbi:uncharacterized protein F5147DRAFT_837608 [Suillus discolor]|uniref:G domain-containing protein n=1 Tax=Suillus discolor TaxID=1912936 RepID=A0A9P7F4D7_9AGAM|nr:uncharacterized protein F5147DRAFT_837608 [Suillus discolor]KAG2107005.1 hypothetical protein F5147DRAFT_837608 [Suillus discolor]